jgi:hypothetical protein
MIRYLLLNHNAAANKTTTRLTTTKKSAITGQTSEATGIQAAWSGIIGTPNGTIQIYGTSENNSQILLTTINVNTANNTANAANYTLDLLPERIWVKYTPNLIIAGKITVVINYRTI